jgi:hypothetical protein
MINCILNCLRRVPWWVWVALTAAGVVFGVASAIAAALSAGTSLVLSAVLWSVAGGVLSAYATTIINCANECNRR